MSGVLNTAHFSKETTKMINVNRLMKVKSNFPVMIGKEVIPKKIVIN